MVDILFNCFLKLVSVEEYQFAREDNQSLALVAFKCLEAMIEQLRQFARIGSGGFIIEFACVPTD